MFGVVAKKARRSPLFSKSESVLRTDPHSIYLPLTKMAYSDLKRINSTSVRGSDERWLTSLDDVVYHSNFSPQLEFPLISPIKQDDKDIPEAIRFIRGETKFTLYIVILLKQMPM